MTRASEISVGVDIGTTSVKALAVDRDGTVVARARVGHRVLTPAPDCLEHDARRAWRLGPRRAYAKVTAGLLAPVAGLAVAAMVPSMTAVDRRGVPLLPGLLYGDVRGRPQPARATPAQVTGLMPDAEGFVRWARDSAPEAAGYWPCQAAATRALGGAPAIDDAVAMSLGRLYAHGEWNAAFCGALGIDPTQIPEVVPMCKPGGTLRGTDTVYTGGTIDALCDQLVAGAVHPGDVLAIFGATLVAWIVTDTWAEVPELFTVPHTVPGRFLVGGPSNAGALFVDWARTLLRGATPRGAWERDARGGDPTRVPVWLPYVRGERTPFNDPMLRASVHGLDITQGPAAIERAAYEASGFVIRRLLRRAGVEGRRIVASGGGTQIPGWMAGVADATGLPVDVVAVPEGAAFGAAFIARLAAGLESSLEEGERWARVGRRYEPDPLWAREASVRFERFDALGPGTGT